MKRTFTVLTKHDFKVGDVVTDNNGKRHRVIVAEANTLVLEEIKFMQSVLIFLWETWKEIKFGLSVLLYIGKAALKFIRKIKFRL